MEEQLLERLWMKPRLPEEDERSVHIVYGSQTGTAQEVAESVSRDAIRRHFRTELCAMDEFDVNNMLHGSYLICVCSTTGQGDPPDNMKRFWRFLMRKSLPHDCLSHLHVAVIGLGDSSYQKYNFIGKKLFRRLVQLSAKPVVPLILCDEQHELGHDASLGEKIPVLWESLLQECPLPPNRTVIPDSELLLSCYKIVDTELSPDPILSNTSLTPSGSSPFIARLVSNVRLTADDHFQDVRLLSLDITGSHIEYEPGDVAYLWPRNLDKHVNEFLSLLNLNPYQRIAIEPGRHDVVPSRLRRVMTWRELVSQVLDISAIPSRYFFELLSHFSKDDMESEKLWELSTPEGQDERFTYANRVRRTIVEILAEFRHTTPFIPPSYILDVVPLLQPRAFSIASAQRADRNVLELLVAVVHYKTKLHEPRLGVCSNWLARMTPPSESNGVTQDEELPALVCPLWVQKGTFRFPVNGQPCIMIGPGTGLAPFRSFIQSRVSAGHHRNLLVFGCRYQHSDFLCHDDLLSWQAANQLTLLTAFSRDQEDKYYVWNVIEDNSNTVWDWVHNQRAFVFIAGNAKRMPDDVRSTFVKIAQEKISCTTEDAEAYLKEMERTNRYQLECWS